MSILTAFFRAKKDATATRPNPWPETPAPVEGAVIVGQIGASVNYWWQVVTQNQDDWEALTEMPGYRGNAYAAFLANHANDSKDVFECVVEGDDPENPGHLRRTRVKMKNKPKSGVVAENVPPHYFGGVEA